jgi:hypothetical protein
VESMQVIEGKILCFFNLNKSNQLIMLELYLAGGGGGSSYVASIESNDVMVDLLGSEVSPPTLTFKNDTCVTFSWVLNWDHSLWGVAYKFDVEISYGPDAEEWFNIDAVDTRLPDRSNNRTLIGYYTAGGLDPETIYSFRVVPIFSKGRGLPSLRLKVKTLAPTINYWEPIFTRRISLQGSGRGFTNPVLQRPHLSTGVQIYDNDTSENPLRYSDPVTKDTPALPSTRRGQTLTLIDDVVYMFGGRTDGA